MRFLVQRCAVNLPLPGLVSPLLCRAGAWMLPSLGPAAMCPGLGSVPGTRRAPRGDWEEKPVWESSELRVHLGPHRLRGGGGCWASPFKARSLFAGRGHCPLALLVSHKAWPMEKPHVWGPHKGKLPWKCLTPRVRSQRAGELGGQLRRGGEEDIGLGPHMHAGGLGVALG